MTNRREELIKEVINLSNKISNEDRELSGVMYCIAIALKNGGSIFEHIDRLKSQMDLAKQLEGILG